MTVDGPSRNVQVLRDLPARRALGDPLEHLPFSARQARTLLLTWSRAERNLEQMPGHEGGKMDQPLRNGLDGSYQFVRRVTLADIPFGSRPDRLFDVLP